MHCPDRGLSMKGHHIVAALFAGSTVLAASMSHAEYAAKKDQISAEYKADKAACDKLEGNNKDICVEKAKGKEKIAKAELEFNYTGKPADSEKIAVAKADASYEVAKEMCDDKKGNDKDLCVKDAKAVHAKAIADAKAGKKS
jgi:outer membrane murein-binding lipoprotein Lpp